MFRKANMLIGIPLFLVLLTVLISGRINASLATDEVDLALQSWNLVEEGEGFWLSVKITSTTPMISQPVVVQLKEMRNGALVTHEKRAEYLEEEISFTIFDSSSLTIIIDPANKIAESNEENNIIVLTGNETPTATVEPAATLTPEATPTISAFDIVAVNWEVTQEEEGFFVTVNLVAEPAIETTARIALREIRNDIKIIHSSRIVDLPGPVEFFVFDPDQLTLLIDPDNLIVETNESNNEVALTNAFQTPTPQPTATATPIPPTPTLTPIATLTPTNPGGNPNLTNRIYMPLITR